MSSHSGVFISGTGTDVGKTFISSLLMAGAHARHLPLRYFKPVQTGADSDTDTVLAHSGCDASSVIPPLISLSLPAAPYRAALAQGEAIDIPGLLENLKALPNGSYIIEGAGGLMVPITENFMMRDLVKAVRLPLVIVASTQLGTINHTLLTIESAQKAEIPIAGVILSGTHDPGLAECIRRCSGITIIAEIPKLNSPSLEQFTNIGASLLDSPQLKKHFTHAQTQPHNA
jgi:dethiobiotin synthase